MNKTNFKRFDDISHTPLRVFNRVVLMQNLFSDFGKQASADYAAVFNEEEKKQIYIMQTFILQKGQEVARKAVTKGLSITKDPEEYVH